MYEKVTTLFVMFLCGLTLAVWLLPPLAGTLRELWRQYATRSRAEVAVIAVFVLCALYVGGTKPTNTQSQAQSGGLTNTVMIAETSDEEQVLIGGGTQMSLLEGGEFPRLTSNQYAAGFALLTRTLTNSAWLAVPSNAVAHAPWGRYGLAEDTFWLPATNWAFVLGTNAVEGAHVSSSGTLSFDPATPKGSPRAAAMPDGDTVSFLSPLQGSLGTVPPQGRFWHAVTTSNSVLMTWQDLYAGRDPDSPVTFQAELFWNGDFTYRYAFANALALTNFVIGAQHNGGGETYALNDTNQLVNGLELRWRAFGTLDPGIDDHDGDGLSTYDEVMRHGTDPRLADSDFDGIPDSAEVEEGSGTRATNPDTDGDGLADGVDLRPQEWDNAEADADGDGFPLWQELFYGTSDAVPGDVGQIFASDSRLVTFTFSGTGLASAVLGVGGFPVPLAGRQPFSLMFAPDTVSQLALGNAPGVSVSVSSQDCIALAGAAGGFAAGGAGAGSASLAAPRVTVGGVCLHDYGQRIGASVTAGLPGTFEWWQNGAPLSGSGPDISQEGVLSGDIFVRFWPEGGNGASCAGYGTVARCVRKFCPHGLVPSECDECNGLNGCSWCVWHETWLCKCACMTLEGGGAVFPAPDMGNPLKVGDILDCCNHSHNALPRACCACPEHQDWSFPAVPIGKLYTLRAVSPKLKLWLDAETRLLAGETVALYVVSAEGFERSQTFRDAPVTFSEAEHPDQEDFHSVSFTVAGLGLGPRDLGGEGRCVMRGGLGCTSLVSVVTLSALTQGSVRLESQGGLFFSETPGAPASSSASLRSDAPPYTVEGARDFWLGATNGGLHTLTYTLLEPDGETCCETNLSVEAVMVRLATNAYYAAYGSAGYLTVDLAPVSHDPAGFELCVDGDWQNAEWANGEPVRWDVDTSGLTAGVHTLTVRSVTFPDLEDSATLIVVSVALKSIEFTSDHNLLKKNPASGSVWGDSSVAYETPEWIEGSRNNPISHTKNTKIGATVKVKVEPSGINFALIGDGADGYVDFAKTGQTSTGADQDIAVTADASLPDQVCIMNKSINWKIRVGTLECSTSSSGNHKIYITYGTPAGSVVTERRVQEVCTTADSASSVGDCADAVFNGLSGSFDLDGEVWGTTPIWLLHDPGEISQCPGIANFVNKHFQMLGLGAGDIRFCHAKPDGTSEASSSPVSTLRTIVPGAEHPDPTTHDDYSTSEGLVHWDGSTPPGANNYEATCLFNSKHYALGVGIFTTAKGVVKTSFASISWECVVLDDPGPPPTCKWETCAEAPWVEAP
jgi:hypothetical protein